MNGYLEEVERMNSITSGVDGAYADPRNTGDFIIASNGLVVGGVSKELVDALGSDRPLLTRNKAAAKKTPAKKPYYRNFSRW